MPALEAAHALAFAERLARERGPSGLIIACLSGRGEKDVYQVAALEEGLDLAVSVGASARTR